MDVDGFSLTMHGMQLSALRIVILGRANKTYERASDFDAIIIVDNRSKRSPHNMSDMTKMSTMLLKNMRTINCSEA